MLSMDFDLDAETASVEFEHRLHILLSSEAVSTQLQRLHKHSNSTRSCEVIQY
jgi:hypothetical protein